MTVASSSRSSAAARKGRMVRVPRKKASEDKICSVLTEHKITRERVEKVWMSWDDNGLCFVRGKFLDGTGFSYPVA
jgi:hypothetical protein